MDKQLVAITTETLAKITFGRTDDTSYADTLVGISQATHGDRDVSMYEGYDLVVARYGEQSDGSILKARFAALLRRQSDGAIRLVRQWAIDGFLETDIMVPHDRRSLIEEAFSTHDVTTRIGVSALCHAYERTDATDEDVLAHDATVLRELAWHVRRAAGAVMTPSLSETLSDTARNLLPTRSGPLTGQMQGQA